MSELITEYFDDGTKHFEYYCDKDEVYQGEYKSWWQGGQLDVHCFYKNDEIHGEYRRWWSNGEQWTHYFLKNDIDITEEITAVVKTINNITDEERTLIKLTWGIPCLPK